MSDHMRVLRRAISDPGATTPRGDNYNEHIVDWQIRAILAQPDALLAVLIDAGVLAEETRTVGGWSVDDPASIERCLATVWEVTA